MSGRPSGKGEVTKPFPKNVPDQPLYFKLIGYLDIETKKLKIGPSQHGYMTLVNLYPTLPHTAVWCLAHGMAGETYWVFNVHRVMRTRKDIFYLDKTSMNFTDYNAALAALQMEGA